MPCGLLHPQIFLNGCCVQNSKVPYEQHLLSKKKMVPIQRFIETPIAHCLSQHEAAPLPHRQAHTRYFKVGRKIFLAALPSPAKCHANSLGGFRLQTTISE